MADAERTDGAVVRPGPDVAKPDAPIQHDGWRSRRAIGSSVASLLIFVAATVMLVWSGRYTEGPGAGWFPVDYWVKSLWVGCAVLAFGWGLLTVDKALEVIKAVLPLMRGGK